MVLRVSYAYFLVCVVSCFWHNINWLHCPRWTCLLEVLKACHICTHESSYDLYNLSGSLSFCPSLSLFVSPSLYIYVCVSLCFYVCLDRECFGPSIVTVTCSSDRVGEHTSIHRCGLCMWCLQYGTWEICVRTLVRCPCCGPLPTCCTIRYNIVSSIGYIVICYHEIAQHLYVF